MLVILNAGLFAKQLLPELVLVYRGREWANTLRRNPITRLTDNTSSIAAICIFCNAKRWIYYRTRTTSYAVCSRASNRILVRRRYHTFDGMELIIFDSVHLSTFLFDMPVMKKVVDST